MDDKVFENVDGIYVETTTYDKPFEWTTTVTDGLGEFVGFNYNYQF